MEDNLEIYFCEICSESVPAKDLATKAAVEVHGKVIGPCCLPGLQRPPAKSSTSTAGMTALGAILLAAVAGATIHLEWRLSEETTRLQGKIEKVETNVASAGSKQLADFERSLDGTMQRGELAPLLQRLQEMEGKVGAVETRLGAKFGGLDARLGGLDEAQRRIIAGQGEIRRDVKDIETELMRLEREVASAAAAPRRVVDADVTDRPVPAKKAAEPTPPAGGGLPEGLAQQVARLKDADAGNRFEAVDQLIQSGNLAVLEHLVPMLKDSDAFVRRLTAEGLANFQDKRSVDALLVALADPESIVRHTAYTSLKKLTKQSIAFDPDGSASARAQAQRRFKEWWAKARDKF